MQLPTLDNPTRYRGLYVFDFGDWTAVGYTLEEVAMLVESEQYADGKVYRICRATPDGHFELKGVPRARFALESGMFFRRATLDAAREDFAALQDLAATAPPPTRAVAHLADAGEDCPAGRYVTAVIYPAEADDDFGQWLLAGGYAGGELVGGGPSHVTNYYDQAHTILERSQLWPATANQPRTREEVYASVRRAVQR